MDKDALRARGISWEGSGTIGKVAGKHGSHHAEGYGVVGHDDYPWCLRSTRGVLMFAVGYRPSSDPYRVVLGLEPGFVTSRAVDIASVTDAELAAFVRACIAHWHFIKADPESPSRHLLWCGTRFRAVAPQLRVSRDVIACAEEARDLALSIQVSCETDGLAAVAAALQSVLNRLDLALACCDRTPPTPHAPNVNVFDAPEEPRGAERP
jgi:hypothetical protein